MAIDFPQKSGQENLSFPAGMLSGQRWPFLALALSVFCILAWGTSCFWPCLSVPTWWPLLITLGWDVCAIIWGVLWGRPMPGNQNFRLWFAQASGATDQSMGWNQLLMHGCSVGLPLCPRDEDKAAVLWCQCNTMFLCWCYRENSLERSQHMWPECNVWKCPLALSLHTHLNKMTLRLFFKNTHTKNNNLASYSSKRTTNQRTAQLKRHMAGVGGMFCTLS